MAEPIPSLRDLPPEEKKRLGYIEGRDDLFPTKVFEIQNDLDIEGEKKEKKKVLVISRDPGSANALWPVMELLYHDGSVAIKAVVDGRAEEILQDVFTLKDITPPDTALEAEEVLGTPDVILIDSSTSERGIEMYATANYPGVPAVLLEDYYTSSRGYLQRLRDHDLPYPRKICVLDSEARNLIVKEFPELEKRIEITGQPAFDRLATEDTEGMQTEIRKELNLAPDEKFITFISAGATIELIEKLAEKLRDVKTKFRLALGIHPRDNTPRETYEKIFKDAGIHCINADTLGINNAGAAADLVILIVSVEGLRAIYRRKPTLHITDPKFVVPQKDLDPPPPVKLGASIGLGDMNDLAKTVEKLLDPESAENEELKKHMDKNYPVDGNNAERVVNILKAEIAKR